jgi:hypothetical protein
MNTARDNYYKECPAVMNYATFTDYRSPSSREEYIRNINNIVSEHEYRIFLQENASQIMDGEWKVLNKEYNCQVNQCIHMSSTRQPEGTQQAELKLYNAIRSGKAPAGAAQCPVPKDYRMC